MPQASAFHKWHYRRREMQFAQPPLVPVMPQQKTEASASPITVVAAATVSQGTKI